MSDSTHAFRAWMSRLDGAVQLRLGVSVHDLPDQPFHDWFTDGLSPLEAAGLIAREAAW